MNSRWLLAGVHRGTLTYELRGLEADGIVQRTQYLTIPPTVEYELTATGAALKPTHGRLVLPSSAVGIRSVEPQGPYWTHFSVLNH